MTADRWTGAAAIVLALIFGFVSWVALVWEPARGFAGLSDYFRGDLLMPALASSVWKMLDRAYLPGAIAVLVVALGFRTASGGQALIRATGSIAAACFLLVGMTGTIAAQVPAFVVDRVAAETASVSLVAVRFIFLRAFVFSLGGFILTVSWVNLRARWFGLGLGSYGLVVAVACLLFWLVLLPVPPALAVWFLLVGVALLRRPAASGDV